MENGETLVEGAMRETMEEAMARVEIRPVRRRGRRARAPGAHDVPRDPARRRFGAGAESLEVALFEPEDDPWDEIAFQSVRFALEKCLEDRAAGVASACIPSRSTDRGPRPA
jgi:8-oxo-dGTP pyrophosphatase MutT (NUDIX family)